MPDRWKLSPALLTLTLAASLTAVAALASVDGAGLRAPKTGEGPADQGAMVTQSMGDADLGRDVFRFETFGNEGFWTDAVRLPAGIMAAKVTPMQMLALGLQVDSDRIDSGMKAELATELRNDPSGRSSKLLNDPAITMKLVMAGAVMGMSPKNGKVGTSCALCHAMSDASVLRVPEGGSIGKRLDGLANHDLNLGKIFATAANTRALYPVAELQLAANKGKVLGARRPG